MRTELLSASRELTAGCFILSACMKGDMVSYTSERPNNYALLPETKGRSVRLALLSNTCCKQRECDSKLAVMKAP